MMQLCLPCSEISVGSHEIHLVFDLLLFRKKLVMRCKCDFMNTFVNACVSLEGRFFCSSFCINGYL